MRNLTLPRRRPERLHVRKKIKINDRFIFILTIFIEHDFRMISERISSEETFAGGRRKIRNYRREADQTVRVGGSPTFVQR